MRFITKVTLPKDDLPPGVLFGMAVFILFFLGLFLMAVDYHSHPHHEEVPVRYGVKAR